MKTKIGIFKCIDTITQDKKTNFIFWFLGNEKEKDK